MGSLFVRTTILATILIGLPFSVSADTLFLSPARATSAVGQTLSVKVFVSSPSQAVNAFSSTIKFPTDKLKVDSISKAGSILTLWVEEPAFSNTDGTIKFEGVIPNPGYTGSSGTLVTINFRPLTTGTAEVKFSGGAVLANDGNGTNILRNSIGAVFEINEAAPVKVDEPVKEIPLEQPVKIPETLKAPEITYFMSNVYTDSPFVIQGYSVSNALIHIYLENEDLEVIKIDALADDTGMFFVAYEKLIPEGKYKLYVVAENNSGLKSLPSDSELVTVISATGSSPLLSFSQSLWILLLILLVLITLIILWAKKRVKDVKEGIKDELEEMENTLDKTFESPRESIEENIDSLEKNHKSGTMSYEQGKVVSKLNESLAETEKEIIKEIRKVEKDIDKK